MARYKKSDIDILSQLDVMTLHDFQRLPATLQWQVIDLIRLMATDAKLAQQDREIAEARYRQFQAVAKKRPARKRG